MAYIIYYLLASFLFTSILTIYLMREDSLFKIIDIPNERSMHVKAVPRSGGLAIFITLVLSFTTLYFRHSNSNELLALLISLSMIAVISLVDDILNLSPLFRLTVHIIASTLVLSFGLVLIDTEIGGVKIHLANEIAVIFTLLFFLWMINLFNFMDGMDGLAGGMAFIGFISLAILGWSIDNLFVHVSSITAFSVLGFLIFNLPQAKIFMGDSGSTLLGFLAGVLIVYATKYNIFPFWIGLLIFSPFIVDATYTLIVRVLSRENIWRAHNKHLYQRLAKLLGIRKTLLLEYVLMLLCAISAIVATKYKTFELLIVVFWIIIYIVIVLVILKVDLNNHESNS